MFGQFGIGQLYRSRHLLIASFFYCSMTLWASHVSAETADEPDNEIVEIESNGTEEVVLEFLKQDGDSVGQSVRGYVGVLDPKSFPGILQFLSNSQQHCTATLVGPKALLTAAHCLGSKNYSIDSGNGNVGMKCFRSKSYNKTTRANDWALCKLNSEVPVSVYEKLDIFGRPEPGRIVMLTGYGCTEEDAPPSKELLYGFAPTIKRPNFVQPEKTAFYTKSSIDNPETGAALCAGDSGGPAIVTGAGGPEDNPRVVGVNSRTDYDYDISWFSATASKRGLKFFDAWVDDQKTPVCGLQYNGSTYRRNCR